jgi:hypothetical protein
MYGGLIFIREVSKYSLLTLLSAVNSIFKLTNIAVLAISYVSESDSDVPIDLQ